MDDICVLQIFNENIFLHFIVLGKQEKNFSVKH